MGAKTLFWNESIRNWFNPATGEFLTPETPDPRADFVIGTTKPTALNTGIYPGTVLTTSLRTSFTGTNTEEFRDMLFPNKVVISGSNKHFINCWFRGDTGSGEIVSAYGLTAGISGTNTFTDCTMAMLPEKVPTLGTTNGKMGFRGHHCRLTRCHFYNVVDGFRPRYNTGVPADNDAEFIAEGCYVHDLTLLSPDTGQANRQSHDDGVQDDNTNGQFNVLIDGCRIDAFRNLNVGQAGFPASYQAGHDGDEAYRTGGSLQYVAGMSYQWANNVFQLPNTGSFRGSIIIRNGWFDGGSAIVNAGGIPNVGLTFTGNRIGRRMRLGQDYVVIIPNSTTVDAISGNTYEDNGTPANFRKNG